MRNILNYLYLQGVPGIEGPQGPPGKEGQRVSRFMNNWFMLAYATGCSWAGTKMLVLQQLNEKPYFALLNFVMATAEICWGQSGYIFCEVLPWTFQAA